MTTTLKVDDVLSVDLGTRVVPITPDMIFLPGDRLGDAIFEGYRTSQSEEWHEQRATGYGGSDVAAICGCSKWTQPFDLWAERTGRVAREPDTKNVKEKAWGKLLEPVIIRKFQMDNPGLIVITAPEGVDMSWRSTKNAWQLASPDALWYDPISDQWGIVEGKTSRWDYEWKDEDGNWSAPEYYRTQDQWYLDVFGWELSMFAVLFGGSDYKELPVAADPFEQKLNREQVAAFDDMVRLNDDRNAPPYRGTDTEVYTQRRMHPEIVQGSVELGDVGAAWQAAKVAQDVAEAEAKAAAAEVLKIMGSMQKGTVDGKHVVSRQGRAGNSAPWLVKK